MGQSYTGRGGGGDEGAGAAARPDATAASATPPPVVARLHPGVDTGLVLAALAGEEAGAGAAGTAAQAELARVRGLLAMGERAREVQHALNNPLAALLAEAQLLQLDAMPAEQRAAVDRIIALARRMVALTRQLDP